MIRWERRLARLEAGVRWLVQRAEEERARPERLARWQAWFESLDRAEAESAGPTVAPAEAACAALPRAGPAPEPPAEAPPPPPLPPPPPPPLVEFINERAGMSIAINTRTGQMASSAEVMVELARRATPKAEGEWALLARTGEK